MNNIVLFIMLASGLIFARNSRKTTKLASKIYIVLRELQELRGVYKGAS